MHLCSYELKRGSNPNTVGTLRQTENDVASGPLGSALCGTPIGGPQYSIPANAIALNPQRGPLQPSRIDQIGRRCQRWLRLRMTRVSRALFGKMVCRPTKIACFTLYSSKVFEKNDASSIQVDSVPLLKPRIKMRDRRHMNQNFRLKTSKTSSAGLLRISAW